MVENSYKFTRFDKLITSLRTAVYNYGTPDKESTLYNNIFDAFTLALKWYRSEDILTNIISRRSSNVIHFFSLVNLSNSSSERIKG